MNLSCRPFSQSSSVRCSMTPPAADPALLTTMSRRPSALWPCSMKFLASASLRRSAGIGTILRPVAWEMSLAAASSGSMRRAQMATSTPSFASAKAIPLPMPSLPPVTKAVLPCSLRSIRLLLANLLVIAHAAYQPPQPLWRDRKFGDGAMGTERVVDGGGDRGTDRIGAAFARPFQAHRIKRDGRVFADEDVDGRHPANGRHQIIGERHRQRLAAFVVQKFFQQRAPNALRPAADNLTPDQHRIDRFADVIGDEIALDVDGAGIFVDFRHGDV